MSPGVLRFPGASHSHVVGPQGWACLLFTVGGTAAKKVRRCGGQWLCPLPPRA